MNTKQQEGPSNLIKDFKTKATVDDFVEQVYPVLCQGRDRYGHKALEKPIEVSVKIQKSPGCSTISSLVDCQYNTGGHGQRCKASHPGVDKKWGGINCPYSFDVPYALEKKR